MFTVFSGAPGPQAHGESVTLIIPVDITPYLANLQLKGPADSTGGGGGGGQNSPLPANRGKRPRFDPTQLTPPTPIIRNEQPKLVAEATLLGPVDLEAPQVDMAIFGDPMGKIGPPSAGPGSGGGIGTGKGTGIGSGKGGGFGPGEGGGAGGGVFRVGNGVTPPRPLFKPEPEYSEEARKAKYQGTVVLYVEIWPDGKAHNIRVVRSLGLGLDDKAIEAVLKWKFAPGKKDNTPVKVGATIEVNFRLL
jgi:TonB family protein